MHSQPLSTRSERSLVLPITYHFVNINVGINLSLLKITNHESKRCTMQSRLHEVTIPKFENQFEEHLVDAHFKPKSKRRLVAPNTEFSDLDTLLLVRRNKQTCQPIEMAPSSIVRQT